MNSVLPLFKMIRHFIFDVDGVLTDGSLILDPGGDLLRTMNIKDGYALQLAIKKGYDITVISGGKSEMIKNRLAALGIEQTRLGIENKTAIYNEVAILRNSDPAQILFMGDDMPDIGPMKLAGLPCCPADACQQVKNISRYISPYKGGHGCVRDVIEKVLTLNGHWE